MARRPTMAAGILACRIGGLSLALLALAACAHEQPALPPSSAIESAGLPDLAHVEQPPDWRTVLSERVATFGHRNVIAVVDAAYPAHSPAGIETIATRSGHGEVLAAVLAEVKARRRVRARAFVDRELERVPESDAPGIDAFRAALAAALKDVPVDSAPHDELLERLGRTSANYRVLILKTDLELPYTSVFLQLESGYWSDEAEKRLRAAGD